jgi:hypothetical protein
MTVTPLLWEPLEVFLASEIRHGEMRMIWCNQDGEVFVSLAPSAAWKWATEHSTLQ